MTTPTYRQVPAQVDLPALEHAVLDFWREQKIFAAVFRIRRRLSGSALLIAGFFTAGNTAGL